MNLKKPVTKNSAQVDYGMSDPPPKRMQMGNKDKGPFKTLHLHVCTSAMDQGQIVHCHKNKAIISRGASQRI